MKTMCVVDNEEIDSSQCLECRCRMEECQEKRAFFNELLENELLEKAQAKSEKGEVI